MRLRSWIWDLLTCGSSSVQVSWNCLRWLRNARTHKGAYQAKSRYEVRVGMCTILQQGTREGVGFSEIHILRFYAYISRLIPNESWENFQILATILVLSFTWMGPCSIRAGIFPKYSLFFLQNIFLILEEIIFENFNISQNSIISVKLAKVLGYGAG